MKIKLGDLVKAKSPHHKGKVFEVVFIEGKDITALYNASDERKRYRIITTEDRLIKI